MRPLVHAACVFLGIATAICMPLSQIRAGYEFPGITNLQVPRVLSRSTVRVFESENGTNQAGSGFVIDNQKGLVVTAAHVVQGFGDHAWVAFPDSKTRYRANVLIAAIPPDFAVLQLDKPPPDALALEVQLEGIENEATPRDRLRQVQ
jgi:S1-C subfamily serine protease